MISTLFLEDIKPSCIIQITDIETNEVYIGRFAKFAENTLYVDDVYYNGKIRGTHFFYNGPYHIVFPTNEQIFEYGKAFGISQQSGGKTE
ncbi:hypothetical protein JC777_00965 [Bacillus cytotoxicus]|uniref:DUF4176 domain-containing protein n=1 Tax=Bacillus cytotoxicus TaxID=580165 RepID=A0AAX2CKN0_9BACI|nr:hypothetical protein [Bacillus cytotoxicus]QTR83186.1 hypothetical protein JC777_00965 [Bacillus cytotoxicus]QTR86923.1 hypothetical protein JC774_20980 [Bacillus cytotoxicus]SCM00624.1 Uncharacterized protein BCB44BAC_03346 [Bacillus cytotoxicus]